MPTYCVKVDWVHVEGNWMRSKKIGLRSIGSAKKWAKKEEERLSKLPQFKKFMLTEIHDDAREFCD